MSSGPTLTPARGGGAPQAARVLQLTLSFRPGGRRRAIETLAQGLREEGAPCRLACLEELGCQREEIEELFDGVACLDKRRLLDTAALGRLDRLITENRVNVLHTHDAASQLVGALARLRRPRLRLLMTFHRTLPMESATRKDRARNALATAMCQAVVVGSRERREHFITANRVAPRKVVRIPFGADTARFAPDADVRQAMRDRLGVSDDTVVLGAVGHFGEEKGVDVVVRAYAEARRRAPVVLVVCGDGPPERRAALERLAPKDGDVRLVGFQPNIADWMHAFDIFVHAPRQEAFGLVLIEAMAAGLPVVATAVGGVPDIVRPGETGELAPAEDVAALALAIERLADDPSARRAMGDAGRRVATREYDTSVYATRHARLYNNLLERRPASGVDNAVADAQDPFTQSKRHPPGALGRGAMTEETIP